MHEWGGERKVEKAEIWTDLAFQWAMKKPTHDHSDLSYCIHTHVNQLFSEPVSWLILPIKILFCRRNKRNILNNKLSEYTYKAKHQAPCGFWHICAHEKAMICCAGDYRTQRNRCRNRKGRASGKEHHQVVSYCFMSYKSVIVLSKSNTVAKDGIHSSPNFRPKPKNLAQSATPREISGHTFQWPLYWALSKLRKKNVSG